MIAALREHAAHEPAPRDTAGGEPVARYVLRAEHHVRAMLRTSAGPRRRVQLRYAVYAAIMLATWGVGHAVGSRGSDLLLIYGAVVFGALALFRPFFVRRQAERLVAGRPDLDRPVEVRVSGGDLVIDLPGVARSAQRLETLHAVYAEPDGVFIEPFQTEAFFVPADGFASPADRAAFERALLAGARIPGPDL